MKKRICFFGILILSCSLMKIGQATAQPKIGGFMQMLYSQNENQNQTEVQRAWFKITGEFNDGKTGYLVILNSGGTKILHNAFIWFKISQFSKISVGKFIPVFGRNWPTYPVDLSTINFSQTGCQTLLVRDVGITWSVERKAWDFKLSLMNGQEAIGDNGQDDNKEKDVYGRLVLKPLSYLEFGSSFRLGKSKEENSEVMGADFLIGNEKINLTGELISSQRQENILGWYILGFYQPLKPIQLVVWFEKVENKTLGISQKFTTLGINYFVQPNTRIVLNYLVISDEADKFLLQLQQVF